MVLQPRHHQADFIASSTAISLLLIQMSVADLNYSLLNLSNQKINSIPSGLSDKLYPLSSKAEDK